MVNINKSETLKKITNGQINKSWKISGVSIDTRNIKKGDLFCALKGVNNDGHDYLLDAFNKGARAVLISKEVTKENKFSYLKVKNVLEALEKIAKHVRIKSEAKFICITGSVGKTGTKELFRAAFGKIEKIYANEGNLNNHIGVPLSLFRMPKKTNICVLELGMNKLGEIKELTNMCMPDIAIITSIENAHLKGLKTLRKIAEAKCEILHNLPKNGCCIYNADTNYSDLILQKAKNLKLKNIISYGKKETADVKLDEIRIQHKKYIVKASIFGKSLIWKMPIIGEHWILNSLSVLGVGCFYNYDLNKITKGMSNFVIPKGRGNKKKYQFQEIRFTIIDDSYNSNPASLEAALLNLNKTKAQGKKIAILGDMLELGSKSLNLHLKIKNIIVESEIDILFTTGNYMEELAKTIPFNIKKIHFKNIECIFKKFKEIISNQDLVLVKGSNGNNLYTLIKFIDKEYKAV